MAAPPPSASQLQPLVLLLPHGIAALVGRCRSEPRIMAVGRAQNRHLVGLTRRVVAIDFFLFCFSKKNISLHKI